MKSIIICEGSTDLVLIQYFLEKTYDWRYIDEKNYKKYDSGLINFQNGNGTVKWLENDKGNYLCILAVGGCSKINKNLCKILDFNNLGVTYHFEKIVVISDRDEISSESDFLKDSNDIFTNFRITFKSTIENNQWNKSIFTDQFEDLKAIEFLPLIIPFEDTGAIETFLLDALKTESEKNDPKKINKNVINHCCGFIDEIQAACMGKYLNKRRDITKAKFDTVFVVMSPAEAFNQRRTLLRSIPWEEFESIQTSFKKLECLCS